MSPSNQLHAVLERLYFSAIVGFTSAILGLGGMLSQAETRWFFITFAFSVLSCGFISLSCKRPNEPFRKVVGRCGIAVLGGMLLTHPVVGWFNIESTDTNTIALALVSCLVSLFTYFVGHSLLLIFDARSGEIADDIFMALFRWLKGKTKNEKDPE